MLALLSSGSNAQGQLASGSFEDSNIFQRCSFEGYPSGTLPTGTCRILNVAAGSNHTIILLELADANQNHFREIWGCGDGRKGQLGLQPQASSNGLTRLEVFKRIELPLDRLGLHEYIFKAVASTWETSYIVLVHKGPGVSDVIVTMGSNDFGDLGVEEGSSAHAKTRFTDGIYIPQIHFFASRISTAATIAIDHISTGQRHIVAHLSISHNNALTRKILIGWGTSRHGQLGNPSSPQSKPPAFFRLPKEISGLQLEDVPYLSSLGIHHSVFLHSSGRISTLGSDRKGQLQAGLITKHAQQIACTWNGTYVVTQNDGGWSVSSSGSNSHGQLGRGNEAGDNLVGDIPFAGVDTKATKIQLAAGSEHVLALIVQDELIENQPRSEVWAWGWNEHGNLGLGHTADVSVPARIWPPKDDGDWGDIQGIWGGCGTSWLSCEVEK
ncbi:regulator of chromosome condensation 1/beta-lactamase-inhibitor protein II [Crepidotus variabilis]|uniref:Regulator of chromosome condensation 1/beta-lactamase-inhibitor protein II n=1 Tax=Crepidotus variabilis TaxID=179855 RepID=A0A9P6EJ57_9AGAR|nr:regulator of chromosome condensation 1/beta-lactamase-inhibitor protein II [Crepidotus variabilis]